MPQSDPAMPYCGRFAPTPSGPLHAGSLFTALASWLCARSQGGRWLLRIDDLDTPRCPPGTDALILRQLEAHGLYWDGDPDYQSRHLEQYHEALAELAARGRLYACTCTRAKLAASQSPGPDGPVYPNTCRTGPAVIAGRPAGGALRFCIADAPLVFTDGLQGRISRSAAEIGDFVVQRSDGQIGYQLACVLDETRLGITEVVRGVDLLGSTIRQRLLMQALASPAPAYAHLPVLLAADGRKLSKQNGAAGIESAAASANLVTALARLGLAAPAALQTAPPAELLAWACPNFSRARLPGSATLPVPG